MRANSSESSNHSISSFFQSMLPSFNVQNTTPDGVYMFRNYNVLEVIDEQEDVGIENLHEDDLNNENLADNHLPNESAVYNDDLDIVARNIDEINGKLIYDIELDVSKILKT